MRTIILLLALTVPAAAGGQHYVCGNLNATLTMTHEDARTIMRRIANDYDRLAKLAEEQLAAQEKQND